MTKKDSRKKAPRNRNKNKETSVQKRILSFLEEHPSKDFTVKQITKHLKITNKEVKSQLPDILAKLSEQGKVEEPKDGVFQVKKTNINTITGVVDFVNPRFAYIVTGKDEEDIKVESRDLNNALNGDTVQASIFKQDGKERGKVIKILERGKTQYVGRVEKSGNYAFVVPDSRKMHKDIFIPGNQINDAENNDKVVVEITEWPVKDKNPEGKVIEVLGKSGENDAEMHSILLEFGLPYQFPQEVLDYANSIPEEIPEKEYKKRSDLRHITTFTIDPEDAKDFDDALSIEYLDNGNFDIGIHIADVSYYVPEDSVLQEEVYNRATSVYLVDRTVPMLPEKLSNQLCSLRPNEDKLAFSTIFELTPEGKVNKKWFGRTIINSDKRFNYEEAQNIMDAGEGPFFKELTTLNSIAKHLRKKRFDHGAIEFESLEFQFQLDQYGVPLSVIPKIRKDVHKLVEEFMLLANRKVAEFVYNYNKGYDKNTMVYRNHDSPDSEKLQTFATFAKKFGYKINTEEDKIAASLNQLFKDSEGKPEENMIQTLAIKTMAKAHYSTDPIGHFGLAFEHYTHFTSPIRRYPDIMVHRLLSKYLNNRTAPPKEDYEDHCQKSGEMEKLAEDAERASIKYKQVEYMKQYVGEVFEGIVSGITERGIFVELKETKCEGMIKMVDIEDDYYTLDQENYRLVGRNKGKIITFGDEATVRVVNTDLDRRTIDLEFA